MAALGHLEEPHVRVYGNQRRKPHLAKAHPGVHLRRMWFGKSSPQPWESQGPKHRPIQFSMGGQFLNLLWVLWQPFMAFWDPSAFEDPKGFKCLTWATATCVPEANTVGRQCKRGSSSQLTCSWGPAVGLVLWEELTCCIRFGSDYFSAVRYCHIHRENEVVWGTHHNRHRWTEPDAKRWNPHDFLAHGT